MEEWKRQILNPAKTYITKTKANHNYRQEHQNRRIKPHYKNLPQKQICRQGINLRHSASFPKEYQSGPENARFSFEEESS